MGVFTSSRQVRQNINLMTPWWLSGASIDLDFDSQRYYDSGLGASAPLAPLNSYLSISRASTGYAETSSGSLTSFGNDTLRITDKGLLVEDARSNIAQQSEALNPGASPWNGSGSGDLTYSADTDTAPNGVASADSLTFTSSSFFYQAVGGQGSGAHTYSFSFYAKGTPGNKIGYRINDFDGGGTPLVGIATLTSTFQRFTVSGSITLGASGFVLFGWDNRTVIDPSLGTAQTIKLWGAQCEAASFASSYIPTAGASATRAMDTITSAGSLDSILMGSTASIVIDRKDNAFTSNKMFVDGATNWTFFRVDGSNQHLVSADDGSGHALQATIGTVGGTYFTDGCKVGIAFTSGARSLVGRGQTVATDANTRVAPTPPCYISASFNSPISSAYIRRLTVWNSKLADATLQSLTAP